MGIPDLNAEGECLESFGLANTRQKEVAKTAVLLHRIIHSFQTTLRSCVTASLLHPKA